MSLRDGGVDAGMAAATECGAGKPTPGLNSCTMKIPMVMEISDAKMNQPRVLAPTRAIEAVPSMRATPTVSVENTNGAMIILMRCKKLVVTNERSAAAESAAAPRPSHSCSNNPNSGPVIMAAATNQVSRYFIGDRFLGPYVRRCA